MYVYFYRDKFKVIIFIAILAPLIEILNGPSFLAMTSIISKLVEPDELGKFFHYRSCGYKFYITNLHPDLYNTFI